MNMRLTEIHLPHQTEIFCTVFFANTDFLLIDKEGITILINYISFPFENKCICILSLY